MNLQEFLSMVALENACSLNSCDPKDYGFNTWHAMYEVISEIDDQWYCHGEGFEEVYMVEAMEFGFTLAAAVQMEYDHARWVLMQAKDAPLEGVEINLDI